MLWGDPDTENSRREKTRVFFVREELGDARSFSLDSPASRRPRLNALREMQGGGD